MKTLLEVLKATHSYLERKGLPEARREAELLLMGQLGITRLELYCEADRPLEPQELDLLRPIVERRGKREPLAYILGKSAFMGLDLQVGPEVLIPRLETEFLVDHVTRALNGRPAGRLLDLCTGSGCIALAIKRQCPDWTICASDLSEQALQVACENGRRNHLHVEWRQGNCEEPWLHERFDVIVANPPYVAESWKLHLEPEVQHEPGLALFSGEEGMDLIARIAGVMPQLLTPGGQLWLEIGFDQAQKVKKLFEEMGRVTLFQDLEGRDRFFRLEVEGP